MNIWSFFVYISRQQFAVNKSFTDPFYQAKTIHLKCFWQYNFQTKILFMYRACLRIMVARRPWLYKIASCDLNWFLFWGNRNDGQDYYFEFSTKSNKQLKPKFAITSLFNQCLRLDCKSQEPFDRKLFESESHKLIICTKCGVTDLPFAHAWTQDDWLPVNCLPVYRPFYSAIKK